MAQQTMAQQRECIIDLDCVGLYRSGSKCLPSGICSNPFVDGCLHSLKYQEGQQQSSSEEIQIRLCNSDDTTPESNCRSSPFHYPEIRVHNQAWEAAIFFSWIIQISLSELLDVPVTVGTKTEDTKASSFYHMENNLPVSSEGYAWDGIRKANELGGNCLLTDEECVSIIPDVWSSQIDIMNQEYADGQLDYLEGNGQVTKLSWYVPRYTAAKYPFAVSHLGLSQDRQRLAEIFKRPTNWGDYCREVSPNNCTVPDGVADRYPSAREAGKYFAEGYIGHFRVTAENNCTGVENNSTCTGHIVAPPCTWSTYIETQTYWLDIALKPSGPNYVNGGYSYSEMIQIWNAANATQSDVIMQWSEPDTVVEMYRNTDAEFIKVFLPTPSQECEAARLTVDERCSQDPVVRRGTKAAACDNSAHLSKKAIAISLRDSTLALSPAEQSPAYAFIQNFHLDQLQINEMLSHYGARGKTGYAAREAVCNWIADNTDYLKSLMPPNHPKVLQHRDDYQEPGMIGAYSVGILALVYILLFALITLKKRKAAVFIYAQVEFVFMVLFGLCLTAIGAILYGMEPNDMVCTSRIWLVGIGYTFYLVTLIIKVSALNQFMKIPQQTCRVKILLNQLYISIMVLASMLGIYLLIWTFVDPLKSTEIRTLEADSTTVLSQYACRSESGYWQTGYNLWEGLLVLWACVLAFHSRHVQAQFNESKSFGMMSYLHFAFLLLRVILSLVLEEDDPYKSSMATSYLLGIEILLAVSIYLVPKLASAGITIQELSGLRARRSSSFQSVDKTIPLAPMTDKPKRMVTGATVETSFSGRLSTMSGTDRISMLSIKEEEKLPIKRNSKTFQDEDEEAELSAHGEQLALNQLHARSSVGHWATERTESTNSGDCDSPVPTNRKTLPILEDTSTVYMLRQQINNLKKALICKDEENEDLQQMIVFLQHNQVAQEAEIQRLSKK